LIVYQQQMKHLTAHAVYHFSETVKKNVLFWQENAPGHKHATVMIVSNKSGFELVGYTPDLATSNYYGLPSLKNVVSIFQ
jgi:hypothetical protein